MPYRIILKPIMESFIDNVLREKVAPEIGSIVYCDLCFNTVEHSGVYVGDNTIVHLDGSGIVEAVSPQEFLARLNGFNTAMSIYVSCLDNKAVGDEEIAKRAKKQVGAKRNYKLLDDNCHQFTSGCITGNFDNNHNLFGSLKSRVEKYLGCNSFRVWDQNRYNLKEDITVIISSFKDNNSVLQESLDIKLVKFTSLLIHYVLDKREVLPNDIAYFEGIIKKHFSIVDTKTLKDMYELKEKIKKEDIEVLVSTFFFSLKMEEQKAIEGILDEIVNQDEKGMYSKYRDINLTIHKLKKDK